MTSIFDEGAEFSDWLDDNGFFPEDFDTVEEYKKGVKSVLPDNSNYFNAIEIELEEFYKAVNEIA